VSRALTIALFQRVFRIYFRQIEAVGLPAEGVTGRVFFANHANGIIDPALILCELPIMVSPLAKAPLFQMPFMAQLLAIAEAVPVHRKRDDPTKKADQNQGMFDSVGKHLQSGGNILIFPEGTSHNEPFVIPIKSGAARMLASAVAQGGKGLSFQAIGLEFDARESFRSRALLVGGPVRQLDDLGIEGGGEPLVAAITEAMKEDLAELVVEGVSWHDRRLIAQVAELLSHDAGDFSLEGWNVIGRKVERIRKTMAGDEPLYERVSKTTGRYYTMLDAAGLTDEALLRNGKTRTPLSYAARLLLLPFALLAVPLYFVPYQLARLSYRMAGTEADVISTYKVAISLLAYPLWTIALLTTAGFCLPFPWALVAAFVVLVAPVSALPWLDWLDRHPLWRNGAPTADELRAARRDAIAEIDAARHLLDPAESPSLSAPHERIRLRPPSLTRYAGSIMPAFRLRPLSHVTVVTALSLVLAAQSTACGGSDESATPGPSGGGASGAAGATSGGNAGTAAGGSAAGSTAGSTAGGASGAAGVGAGAGAGGGAAGASGAAAGTGGAGGTTAGEGGSAGAEVGGNAGAGGDSAGGGSGGAAGTIGGTGGGGGSAPTCADTCKGGTCLGETCCLVENVCGSSCCAIGDVCSFDKCLTPGGACADSSDCGATEFCDLSLGEPTTTPPGGDGTCSVGAAIPSGKCLPRPPECAPGEGGPGPITCVQACQFVPPTIPFQPTETYAWGDDWKAVNTPNSIMMAPIVMQLDDDDCDGKVTERDIPDIVFSTFSNSAYNSMGPLHAISVKDGKLQEKWVVPNGAIAGRSIAAGNFDGKPGNEVVVCTTAGTTPNVTFGIAAYEGATGKLLWSNPTAGNCVMPYIADLDQDGKPEIITESGIFRGADGSKKASFSTATIGRLAVSDLDGDGLLDIIDAFHAYRGDGTLFATVPAGSIPTGDSYLGPAIADLDGDGRPEVITPVFNNHKVAIWHLNETTGQAELARPLLEINDKFPEPFCVGGTPPVSRPRGGGPVTAGDFDNDGLPDIALAGGVGYVVFSGKRAMDPSIASVDALLWAKQTQDCSSAQTGSSLFDFDGDGKAEVVYADEVRLHVYDGETGEDLFNTCSTNGTLFEYPLVADIDRDGHADLILVSNSYSGFTCGDSPATKRSGLRVFSDPRWVRTRGVWNEHGYHVTNVGEDGSIPAIEPANWKDKRLNNYRQNKQPGQEFSAPDVVVSLSYPKCQGDYGLIARVTNVGEASVPAGVVVGFYEGAPGASTKLGSAVTKGSLYPAQSENVTLTLPNPSDALTKGTGTFYVVVDDASDPHPAWTECRTDNNTGAASFGTCGKD
jgi:hypothetical protein